MLVNAVFAVAATLAASGCGSSLDPELHVAGAFCACDGAAWSC